MFSNVESHNPQAIVENKILNYLETEKVPKSLLAIAQDLKLTVRQVMLCIDNIKKITYQPLLDSNKEIKIGYGLNILHSQNNSFWSKPTNTLQPMEIDALTQQSNTNIPSFNSKNELLAYIYKQPNFTRLVGSRYAETLSRINDYVQREENTEINEINRIINTALIAQENAKYIVSSNPEQEKICLDYLSSFNLSPILKDAYSAARDKGLTIGSAELISVMKAKLKEFLSNYPELSNLAQKISTEKLNPFFDKMIEDYLTRHIHDVFHKIVRIIRDNNYLGKTLLFLQTLGKKLFENGQEVMGCLYTIVQQDPDAKELLAELSRDFMSKKFGHIFKSVVEDYPKEIVNRLKSLVTERNYIQIAFEKSRYIKHVRATFNGADRAFDHKSVEFCREFIGDILKELNLLLEKDKEAYSLISVGNKNTINFTLTGLIQTYLDEAFTAEIQKMEDLGMIKNYHDENYEFLPIHKQSR